MLMDLILKSIPRSWKAGVALLLMLVFSQQAFDGLQSVIVPGGQGASAWSVIKLVLCLVLSVVSVIAFYYFQSLDRSRSKQQFNSVEYLNQYQEAQKKEAALRHSATPVFSSHDGVIPSTPATEDHAKPKSDILAP